LFGWEVRPCPEFKLAMTCVSDWAGLRTSDRPRDVTVALGIERSKVKYNRLYLYSFFNLGCRLGWVTPHPGRFTPGNNPLHIV